MQEEVNKNYSVGISTSPYRTLILVYIARGLYILMCKQDIIYIYNQTEHGQPSALYRTKMKSAQLDITSRGMAGETSY